MAGTADRSDSIEGVKCLRLIGYSLVPKKDSALQLRQLTAWLSTMLSRLFL